MEPTAPVRPVYDGPGLSNLVPALLGAQDAPWLPEPTRAARTVVVLVIDGLGWEAVTSRAEMLPEITKLTGGPITTVAPSTTASALTSITTGRTPADHGVVGYRILVDQIVLNVLSWQASNGRRTPEPFTIQRHPPFFGREIDIVTKAEFARTGFTEAHLRGTRFHGWKTVSSLVEHCRTLAAARTPFIYAYYDGVDAVAHARGLHDGFYDAELRFADRLVGDLLDALPEEAALVVVSDHGQVHVGPEGWRDLDGVAGLFERGSGDGRFRYLHAKRGAAPDLLATATELYRPEAWVLGRDQLLDEGWLGPVPSPATRRRVGDVVIAARGPVAYVDPDLEREAGLISAHGSLTEAEMMVPLVAGRGRA